MSVRLFVCLSVIYLAYLSFTQFWKAVESSYFSEKLPLTLVNGDVIPSFLPCSFLPSSLLYWLKQ